MLENVEEFKTWGPLNRRHHPIKSKQGKTFEKFVQQLTDLGYKVEFRELIAADYGAPTMRKRFFMIARCDGKTIVWPEPTHAPADSEEVKKGLLKPYVGAYTQLDFSLPCPSIFDTSEEIKEKSITVKIQAGVEGRVFGSISSKEIALEAKKQLNMDIDKKKIIIPDAIKSLGTYNVNIKLHKDVMATLAVKVEAK